MAPGQLKSTAHRRAQTNAWLAFAVLALAFVPLPAVWAYTHSSLAERQFADAMALLGVLLRATPVFAVPPFVLGGGIGGLLYLVLSARERLDIIDRGGEATLNSRALVASSLVGAALFASVGLVMALMFFRVVG